VRDMLRLQRIAVVVNPRSEHHPHHNSHGQGVPLPVRFCHRMHHVPVDIGRQYHRQEPAQFVARLNSLALTEPRQACWPGPCTRLRARRVVRSWFALLALHPGLDLAMVAARPAKAAGMLFVLFAPELYAYGPAQHDFGEQVAGSLVRLRLRRNAIVTRTSCGTDQVVRRSAGQRL